MPLSGFGFMPSNSDEYYFLSYNREDIEQIAPIVRLLYDRGVPLWYDIALTYGEEWKSQIAKNIQSAKAVIMFITDGIFKKIKYEKVPRPLSYVVTEFDFAEMYEIQVIPVFLTSVDSKSIPSCYADFWRNLNNLHGIMDNSSALVIAEEIMCAIGVSSARNSSDANTAPGGLTSSDTASTSPYVENVFSAGNLYTIGKYPQSSFSPSPIRWRIIYSSPERVLLLSDMLLDAKPFNLVSKSVTWETSSLRYWLNHDFLNSAFTEEERERIIVVNNKNELNPRFGTDSGNQTLDQIFCLSIDEVNRFLLKQNNRDGITTVFARTNGAYAYKEDFSGWWWLRTSGANTSSAAYIAIDGSIAVKGNFVNNCTGSVRPALWLRL